VAIITSTPLDSNAGNKLDSPMMDNVLGSFDGSQNGIKSALDSLGVTQRILAGYSSIEINGIVHF